LELDFMREMYCFDYLNDNREECISIMNGFISDTKDIVTAAEKKYGHKIRLGVRLNRDIEQSRFIGFDARAWAREGWVDLIVPSPRWASSDSRMPMDVWRRELPNVEVIPCVDTVVVNKFYGNAFATPELTRGNVGGYLANGAHDIYLFNYFGDPHDNKEYYEARDREVHRTCKDLKVIESLPVRYAVMEQEERMIPQGFVGDQPLPLVMDGGVKQLTINTAHISPDREVSVVLGFTKGTPDDVTVTLNGVLCQGFSEIELPEPVKVVPQGTKCYRCPATASLATKQLFEFVGQDAEIIWVEISVK